MFSFKRSWGSFGRACRSSLASCQFHVACHMLLRRHALPLAVATYGSSVDSHYYDIGPTSLTSYIPVLGEDPTEAMTAEHMAAVVEFLRVLPGWVQDAMRYHSPSLAEARLGIARRFVKSAQRQISLNKLVQVTRRDSIHAPVTSALMSML